MVQHEKAPAGGNRRGAFENYVLGSAQSEDTAKATRSQAPDLVSAMLLAARQHAVAGLRSYGSNSHAELSLSRLYDARASVLALVGEVR